MNFANKQRFLPIGLFFIQINKRGQGSDRCLIIDNWERGTECKIEKVIPAKLRKKGIKQLFHKDAGNVERKCLRLLVRTFELYFSGPGGNGVSREDIFFGPIKALEADA